MKSLELNCTQVSEIKARLYQISRELNIKDIMVHIPEQLNNQMIPMPVDAINDIFSEIMINSKNAHAKKSPAIYISIFKYEDDVWYFRVIDDSLTLETDCLSTALTSDDNKYDNNFSFTKTRNWISELKCKCDVLRRCYSLGVIISFQVA